MKARYFTKVSTRMNKNTVMNPWVSLAFHSRNNGMVIIQNVQRGSYMKYQDHARRGEDGRLHSVPIED